VDCDAQLRAQIYKKVTYNPSKLGQIGWLFGLWSNFISRSVRPGW